MPSIANLTVKKNDGVTDITYSYVSPSAGDRSPAVWRSQSVGTALSHQPSLKVFSRDNGQGTGRRMDVNFQYPTLVTGSDGRVSVADRLPINITAVIPSGMATADVNEAVSQALNLAATALMKDQFKTGYAAS